MRNNKRIIITYQHKAREIEALCLMRYELEKRGFTVDFICTFENNFKIKNFFLRNACVITSSLYDEGTLEYFAVQFAGFQSKVINLQWEQVLSIDEENDPNGFHHPVGLAKEAIHLCWGNSVKERLIKNGVSQDRAIVTGPIYMDFYSDRFNSYFYDKNYLSKKFNLDINKKWCLFISSFTLPNMTDEEFEWIENAVGEEVRVMKSVSTKSKRLFLDWLKKYLQHNQNIEFIYRPHPDETTDEELIDMSLTYSNFHIIFEFAIKQWIKNCDHIYIWYSTSIADIYFANKTCHIIRPLAIPEIYELSIYKNAELIKTYQEFEASFDIESSFPLKPHLLNSYFHVDQKKPSYLKACDVIEDVIKSKNGLISYNFIVKIKMLKNLFFMQIKNLLIKDSFYNIFQNTPILGLKIKKHRIVSERLIRDKQKNVATDAEINLIMSKIKKSLD